MKGNLRLRQRRVKALNAFIHDIYHDQEILKAGRIREQVLNNAQYRRRCRGVDVPCNVYVRTSPGWTWCALAPVSSMCWKTICGAGRRYMLEDRG